MVIVKTGEQIFNDLLIALGQEYVDAYKNDPLLWRMEIRAEVGSPVEVVLVRHVVQYDKA